MQQPVFAATDVLEYPELHDESIPFMAFMSSLFKLLRAAGVKDFNMQVSTVLCPPARPRYSAGLLLPYSKHCCLRSLEHRQLRGDNI